MTHTGNRPPATHREVADRARRVPGVWVRVNAYRTRPYAASLAAQIRAGAPRLSAYGPAGTFEARIEDTEMETEVHVRYVATTTPGEGPR